MSALGNEDLLKYQRAVLKTSEEQVRRGNELFKEGDILESDKLMFEAQYATDLNNITNTEIARDNNLLTLKSLLSLDPINRSSRHNGYDPDGDDTFTGLRPGKRNGDHARTGNQRIQCKYSKVCT